MVDCDQLVAKVIAIQISEDKKKKVILCQSVAALRGCLSVCEKRHRNKKEMLSHAFTLVFNFQVWKFSILGAYV